MTGFIRGLFGGGKKNDLPPVPEDKTAYYLDADDAKSFGNIEYMRTSKTVRRTFARKKGVQVELESIKQVSALEAKRLGEIKAAEAAQANSFAPKPEASPSRRQGDSSMDMFRNMAKDMKK